MAGGADRPAAVRLAAALLIATAACAAAPPGVQTARPAAPSPSPLAALAAAAPEGYRVLGPHRVLRAVDGDTLLLATTDRVRLLGVDTPELQAEDRVVRELARAAAAELARRVGSRDVLLVVGVPERDRYGRILAYVHRTDPDGARGEHGLGEDVGAALLAAGFAQPYPSAHPRLEEYRRLAREAREAERGLWSDGGRQALRLDVEAEIAPSEAARWTGRRVRAVGVVARARRTEAGLFLDLADRAGARKGLLAVAFAPVLPLFPADAERRWEGARVAITGVVEDYRGRAEIVLRDPEQVDLRGPIPP